MAVLREGHISNEKPNEKEEGEEIMVKRTQRKAPQSTEWEAGLKKGRVRNYIRRKDGNAGFNKNGTLKISAIKQAMKNTKDKGMKKALAAALTLKSIGKRKGGKL